MVNAALWSHLELLEFLIEDNLYGKKICSKRVQLGANRVSEERLEKSIRGRRTGNVSKYCF
jgi:hypothetical protein